MKCTWWGGFLLCGTFKRGHGHAESLLNLDSAGVCSGEISAITIQFSPFRTRHRTAARHGGAISLQTADDDLDFGCLSVSCRQGKGAFIRARTRKLRKLWGCKGSRCPTSIPRLESGKSFSVRVGFAVGKSGEPAQRASSARSNEDTGCAAASVWAYNTGWGGGNHFFCLDSIGKPPLPNTALQSIIR